MEVKEQPQTELPRVLNASHATSIVVGIIIGSGIFLVPREMMAAVGSSGMVYAVWIVGGLLSLFGAMTYAEIAALRPKYGGEYAFLREAYGGHHLARDKKNSTADDDADDDRCGVRCV